MLKIAVVGVGGISGAHIPCWQEMNETELTAICDIRPEQMEKVRRCEKIYRFGRNAGSGAYRYFGYMSADLSACGHCS